MAYERYATEFKDKDNNVYGVMDEEARNIKADVIAESITTPADVQTFTDGADGMPMGIEVAVEPVQDLHGYDSPWAGGAGKNIAYLSVNHIKNANSGTWDGNVTVINNVTFTILTDSDGNVTGIKANGTASANTGFYLFNNKTIPAGSYILSGCPVSGNENVWLGTFYDNSYQSIERGSGVSFTLSQDKGMALRFRVGTGQSVSNVVVLPMIRLASVTDDTYAPYSNICPITGWTGANTYCCPPITQIENYYIAENGTVTSNAKFSYTDYIHVNKGETWTITGVKTDDVSQAKRIHGYYANKAWKEQIAYYIQGVDVFGRYTVVITIPDGVEYIRVSHGKGDTDFSIGRTFNVTFPTEAGTVYGGTLTINRDGTGSLVVDKGIWTIPEITTINDSGTSGSTGKYIQIITNGSKQVSTSEHTSLFEANKTVSYDNRGKAWEGYSGSNAGFHYMFVPSNATLNDVNTAIQGTKIVAELATPVTYTFTAQQIKSLLGTNNLWADCGGVNRVDYNADTKKYIDNLFASIVNATGVSF